MVPLYKTILWAKIYSAKTRVTTVRKNDNAFKEANNVR
jgi:hypothetical protein